MVSVISALAAKVGTPFESCNTKCIGLLKPRTSC